MYRKKSTDKIAFFQDGCTAISDLMNEQSASSDRRKITAYLAAVDQHAAELFANFNQTSSQSNPLFHYISVLSTALEELRIAEEELCQHNEGLRVTEEELCRQNEELREARQALDIERQRYQELFEFAPDGYLVTDPHGKIQEANRAAVELLNVDAQYLVGKLFVNFVPEEQRRGFRTLLVQLQSVERVQEWEIDLIARGGKRFEAALTIATVQDQAGHTIALRWLLRDITARKKIEEQLRQIQLQNLELLESDRLKAQFIATMSHELRTPLNAILGFSNLLLHQFHAHFAPHQTYLIERIFDNGRHLLELIEDILDFSKLRSNELELQVEEFDLVELIHTTVEELRSLALQKKLALHVQVAQSKIPMVSDRVRLRQLLVNLISNAIKFTDEGSVSVQVRSLKRGRISIAVQDTGIGIAEGDLNYIFQEFRQVNQTITRRHGGTGLGLAITQALTELMGGEISVESQLGKGSTFLVELPERLDRRGLGNEGARGS